MAKKVVVPIQIDPKPVEDTTAAFVKLQTQIKLADKELQQFIETGDTDKIIAARNKINDLRDALERAKFQSKDINDQLALLPGPLGDVASSANQAVGVLRSMKGITFKDISGSVAAFADDIKDATNVLGELTGANRIFIGVASNMYLVLRNLGLSMNAAGVAARFLASGLGLVTGTAFLLGIAALAAAWQNYTIAQDRANQSLKEFNEQQKNIVSVGLQAELDLIARRKNEDTADAKRRITDKTQLENALYKIDMDARKRQASSLQRSYNELKSKDTDYARELLKQIKDLQSEVYVAQDDHQVNLRELGKQGAVKVKTDAQKANEADLNQIKENNYKAYLLTLEAQDRELAQAIKDYDDQIALAEKHNKDTTALRTAKGIKVQEINDRFAKEAKDAADKALKEETAGIDAEYKRQEDRAKEAWELRLKLGKEQADWEASLLKQREENAQKEREINKAVADSWIGLGQNIGNSFQQIGQLFEQGSDMAKTFGIISVLVNGAAAVAKVLSDTGEGMSSATKVISQGSATAALGAMQVATNPFDPRGYAMVKTGIAGATTIGPGMLAAAKATRVGQISAIGVSTAAQIAAITSAKKGSTSSSGGGSMNGGSVTTSIPSLAAPQIGGTASNPNAQLAGMINQGTANQGPIRAYILNQDIRTANQFDRRIAAATKL
jgi:hypothetical protein